MVNKKNKYITVRLRNYSNSGRRQKAPLTPRNMSTDKDVFCNIDARKQSGVTVVDPDTCEEVEVGMYR